MGLMGLFFGGKRSFRVFVFFLSPLNFAFLPGLSRAEKDAPFSRELRRMFGVQLEPTGLGPFSSASFLMGGRQKLKGPVSVKVRPMEANQLAPQAFPQRFVY